MLVFKYLMDFYVEKLISLVFQGFVKMADPNFGLLMIYLASKGMFKLQFMLENSLFRSVNRKSRISI